MRLDVMHWEEWNAARHREALCKVEPHEQRTDKAGSLCRRDMSHIADGSAGGGQGFAHDRHNRTYMRARGKFRHDAAETRVKVL